MRRAHSPIIAFTESLAICSSPSGHGVHALQGPPERGRAHVLGRLAGPQMADLDGDETRHKILFCDGMLYDFKKRVLRSPISADRVGFHAKATSEMWQPSKATKLFEHILAFLKEHLETRVCLLEASENGKQVIECFEELEQDGCSAT